MDVSTPDALDRILRPYVQAALEREDLQLLVRRAAREDALQRGHGSGRQSPRLQDVACSEHQHRLVAWEVRDIAHDRQRVARNALSQTRQRRRRQRRRR